MILNAHIPIAELMPEDEVATLQERLLRQPHVRRVEREAGSHMLAVEMEADYPTFLEVQRLAGCALSGQSTKCKTMACLPESEAHIG